MHQVGRRGAGGHAALEAEIAAGVLSKWALPERIDIVAELARTSVGKIDKKRLRAEMTPG